MPVNMERRYKKDTAPWRAQQLTLARRQVNRKRAAEAEYREAVEDAEREGKPPPPPLAPFTMKRSNSDDLFADNREFEEGNGFGSSKKEAESRRRNKGEEKREKAEREKKEAEAAAREARKRVRDKERRRIKELMLLMSMNKPNHFMPPYGVQYTGYQAPPFYPPPSPLQYPYYGYPPPPHAGVHYNNGYQAEHRHLQYGYESIQESIQPHPRSIPPSRSEAFNASPSATLAHVAPEQQIDYDQPLIAAERGEASYVEAKKVNPPPMSPQNDKRSRRCSMAAPLMRQIPSGHPLQKRSPDRILSDPQTDVPSTTTGNLDPVNVFRSRPSRPIERVEMSDWNHKESVSFLKKGRKQVRVEDPKPSTEPQQRKASRRESPVIPEQSFGSTRFHSVDNAKEDINQALYRELELMLGAP